MAKRFFRHNKNPQIIGNPSVIKTHINDANRYYNYVLLLQKPKKSILNRKQ